jgi:hypothetical protein
MRETVSEEKSRGDVKKPNSSTKRSSPNKPTRKSRTRQKINDTTGENVLKTSALVQDDSGMFADDISAEVEFMDYTSQSVDNQNKAAAKKSVEYSSVSAKGKEASYPRGLFGTSSENSENSDDDDQHSVLSIQKKAIGSVCHLKSTGITVTDADLDLIEQKDIMDFTIPMNLFFLSLLIHSTDDCLICQPKANYRPLSISDIKDKDFINSMTQKGKDIAEEIYVLLYEVNDGKKSINEASKTLIYQSYTTDDTSIDLLPIQNKYATFPTDGSLRKLAKSLGITENIETTGGQLTCDIFSIISHHLKRMIDSLFVPSTRVHDKNKDWKVIAENYRSLRNKIQTSSNVRIAVVGGLHRSALATHVLGNYIIHNKSSRVSDAQLYQLHKGSPVFSRIAVHLMLPDTNTYLNDNLLARCRRFSETVNNRKLKAIFVPIRGQLYDLLKEKSTETIDQFRYLPGDLLGGTMVRLICKNTLFGFFTGCI